LTLRNSIKLVGLYIALLGSPILAATPEDATQAAAMLAGTAGQWSGELQYRDYQSDSWQGIPMTVAVVAQPDGVTTVRTAQFDDGPPTGIVTITTMGMVDVAATGFNYVGYRRLRAPDSGSAQISDVRAGSDATHWTIVTIENRLDGNSMAQVRETTTRDGDRLTTLKEVNPTDDNADTWLPRNRTILQRVAG
jgi:hypothetical protein